MHKHRYRIIYHRFIEDRKHLLANPFGNRIEACTAASCQYYSFHILLFVKILDALLLAQAADEETAFTLHYHTIFQALEYNACGIRSMDDAAVTVVQMDIIAYHGISVVIVVEQSPERTPCADITPAEIRRQSIAGKTQLEYESYQIE